MSRIRRLPSRQIRWLAVASSFCAALASAGETPYHFTATDRFFLASFSLSALPPLPPTPSNAFADNLAAARLGRDLFYDQRLSANGKVACSTCHQPERYFTDGRHVSQGIGVTRRSAPSVLPAVYSPWQYWDGRKDSLWSQALGPLEHPDEQGLDRLGVVQQIIRHHDADFRRVFGEIPQRLAIAKLAGPASPLGSETAQANWERIRPANRRAITRAFANLGKAIMAYERRLVLPPAPFDRFLEVLATPGAGDKELRAVMDEDAVRGMRLFMGKGNCASCHNGPLFSNFEFHNVGAPEPNKAAVDLGRHAAIALLLADEFTCLAPWSDAAPEQCEEMRFLKRQGPELVGAYKTPSLRNVAQTAPYMQSGQLATLPDVLAHYNKPSPPFFDRAQHPNRPHFDILPLQLSEEEIAQLIAFLHTLTSPRPSADEWWPAAAP